MDKTPQNNQPTPANSPQQQKKTSKVALIIIIAVATFLAVFTVIGYMIFTTAQGATNTSDEFLSAIQASDGDAAYNLFSDEAKEEVPRDQFEQVVAQIGPILDTGESKTGTSVEGESGSDTRATVTYEIVGTDGVTYDIIINLVDEDGEWKVFNFESKRQE